MPRLRAALIAPFLLAAAVPAPTLFAQPPETAATAATPFDRRAAQLVDVLTGKLAFAAYFAPSFQAAIPEAQFKAIPAGLIAHYGQPLAVEAATSTDGHAGPVRLRFERRSEARRDGKAGVGEGRSR